MGQIYTFYSYKGGVGRSMSLANIAYLLSQLGYDVLIIDFDLEAPGLEVFFNNYMSENVVIEKEGIIDLLYKLQKPLDEKINTDSWRTLINKFKFSELEKELHFISSGKKDANYFTKVRTFNIESAYENNGEILENIRNEWKNSYDFILIDSRTGITDYGGICTVHLPDILILFYVTTEQSLDGVIDIYNKAKTARKKLPFDRKSLIALPILSKFDSSEEYKISQEWIELSTKRLSNVYKNWLPKEIKLKDFVELTKIPYISYFSFGEKLAVKEQSSKDPTGMVYAYETLSALIADNLENVSNIIQNRDTYIQQQNRKLKDKELTENYKRKIFINYADADKYLATELYNKLSYLGLEPWIDIKNIQPGESFQESIENTIKESDIFLSIITNNYSNSTRAISEFDFALNIFQTKINTRLKIVPLIFETVNIPGRFSNFKSLDFSKQQSLNELISFIRPEYKTEQSNWSKDIEEKWIQLLEEDNEIKIKRQIFDIKDTLNSCFYEILELDGKEVQISLRQRFWNSINTIFLQLLVLIRYDIDKYFDELFNVIVDTYNKAVGPYPQLSEDYSKGKQAEIWFGIILRIYLVGAVALNLKKYQTVSRFIKVNPGFSGYWSKHYWARHAQVLFARSRENRDKEDRNGIVYYAMIFFDEQYWIHRFLDPKNPDTLNRLCEFDYLQCFLSILELNNESTCYPSYAQYDSWRTNNLLLDIVSKRNAYQVIAGISDKSIADIIIRLDKYADKVYGYYSGYDRSSFPPEVMNFLKNNESK